MNTKRSLILLLSLCFISSLVLSACETYSASMNENASSSKQAKREKKTEPFDLTLRHTQVGKDKEKRFAMLNDVVKKVEAEVNGLTFRLDGVDSDVNRKEKLRGEMAAGNPPDIFDLFGSPDFKIYAKEGKLLDLTPIIEELGIKDKFTSLEPFTYEGKVYGLPIGGTGEGFFYNKEYFEKKGWKPPTTFAELERMLAEIKADGKIPIAAASKAGWVPLMLTNHLWSRYAGPEITAKFATGEAKWTDPNVVKAFAKHREWKEKGYFTEGELGYEYPEYTTQFTSGQAILMYDGTWKSSVFKKGESGAKLFGKVGFFNMPPVVGGVGDQTALMLNVNNGYGFSAAVAKDPRKLEAVKSFIKNMFNEDMQIRGFVEDGVLPSMKLDASVLASSINDNLMKEIVDVLDKAQTKFTAFDALVQADVTSEISNVQIQKLISGQTTPEKMAEALQKVQDEANLAAR
ncbi:MULTISPECIES: extracellular solute-binding protein [Paenibacillus]|uniref:ABC transporter substrate-binding protein n=1 Tax=Paenibacillus azoreducens TaxID=116718 RepID=A0A919YBK5_9BACL|nr:MULTISPECIES: extracellular solute-binding protein [Paenibacillus]MBE9913050.1 extracellular solute-binding protein [Paenibacillus donghaensis]GIO47731.1 ABC transporter substrate-binding protein [Paenibacillus azoreducens]